jgi:hypothetical protein
METYSSTIKHNPQGISCLLKLKLSIDFLKGIQHAVINEITSQKDEVISSKARLPPKRRQIGRIQTTISDLLGEEPAACFYHDLMLKPLKISASGCAKMSEYPGLLC